MNEISADQLSATILYIDDEDFEHDIIRRMTRKHQNHYQVISAVDISSAIDILSQEMIDLILLDNHLYPEIDITQSVPKIRKSGYVGPIIVVSSYISDEIVQKSRSIDVDLVICKEDIDISNIQKYLLEYSHSQLSIPDSNVTNSASRETN